LIFVGDIAQLGERRVRIAEVGGSNPPISTKGYNRYNRLLLPHRICLRGPVIHSKLAHAGPEGKSVPVYYAKPGSLSEKYLTGFAAVFAPGGAAGVSVAPYGIVVRIGCFDMELVAHECYHFEETIRTGEMTWYAAYFTEIALRAYTNINNPSYKFDLKQVLFDAYANSGAEIRAKAYAAAYGGHSPSAPGGMAW
jgi:hypothetical protein